MNSINNVNNINFLGHSLNTSNNDINAEDENVFGAIFNSAIRLFDATSQMEHEAHQLQVDYMAGRTDDMLAVILAEQRALTAVTFTAQMVSSVMDSYRQIMNLQV